VGTRLRSLVEAWERAQSPDGAQLAVPADVAGQLESATDEEIFAFIRTEFGRSDGDTEA
jgi:polyketide synthase 7